MRRREFIVGLGSAAAGAVGGRAQQPAIPVIGFLYAGSPASLPNKFLAAFHQGLADTGYVEGRNVVIEYRWAEGQYDRLVVMATDLVRRQVAVIATPDSTAAALVAKTVTQVIPI